MSGFPFLTTVRPVFGDMDPAGILYYPRFLHLCHVAMEAFLEEALGRPYAVLLKDPGLGFPTVHLEVDYRVPVAYGVTLRFACSVVRLGTKSAVFRFRATGDDGVLRAEAVATTVCTAMDGFVGVPLPPEIRAGLLRFQEAEASDAAPGTGLR